MPYHNLQLVLRPTPGGLKAHQGFVSTQASIDLKSHLFSDLRILTTEGPVACHSTLLAPLSPFLSSVLASYPSSPGLVHTLVMPVKRETVENILQIIYRGKVTVKSRDNVDQVLSGLAVLGIHLPGLECYKAAGYSSTTSSHHQHQAVPSVGQALDFSRTRLGNTTSNSGRGVNNNVLPTSSPLSRPKFPTQLTRSNLLSAIVKLPSTLTPAGVKKDTRPLLPPAQPLAVKDLQMKLARQLLPLGLGEESAECNVAGCSEQVTLKTLESHFEEHKAQPQQAFKCDQCVESFNHKKALEIHRLKCHDKSNENSSLLMASVSRDENTLHEDSNYEFNDAVTMKRKYIDEGDESTSQSKKRKRGHDSDENMSAETSLFCSLCQAPLASEWYRHPRRHKCPHSTPMADPPSTSTTQAHCTLCSTPVSTPWYLPPSRHGCAAVSSTTSAQEPQSDKSSAATARKRSRSSSVRPKETEFQCEKCVDTFTSLVALRSHYTVSHYWERIAAQFANWGSRCYICLRAFQSSDQLVRHMGNFHSFVDQCLSKENLNFITVENTLKLLSLECGLCGEIKGTSSDLKVHLSFAHFSKELGREFPGDSNSPSKRSKKCGRCSKIFNNNYNRIKHIGAFHDQVLKYAKQFVVVEDGDYIPENSFAEGIDITGEPFEEEELAKYLTDWEWEPLSVSISHSPKVVNDDDTNTPESIQPKESPTKSVPAEASTLLACPLTNCTRKCRNQEDLQVHLAMAHYMQELEKEFDTGQGEGESRCHRCDKILPSNKQGFMKHMAVEHKDIVMGYVERDMALEAELNKAVESVV